MSEKFDFSKPEDQKKVEGYRHEYKQEIKEAAYEEAAQLKELVKSGEAKDYNEAEIKLAERILKEREETKDWIKKDYCDPKNYDLIIDTTNKKNAQATAVEIFDRMAEPG